MNFRLSFFLMTFNFSEKKSIFFAWCWWPFMPLIGLWTGEGSSWVSSLFIIILNSFLYIAFVIMMKFEISSFGWYRFESCYQFLGWLCQLDFFLHFLWMIPNYNFFTAYSWHTTLQIYEELQRNTKQIRKSLQYPKKILQKNSTSINPIHIFNPTLKGGNGNNNMFYTAFSLTSQDGNLLQ